MMTTDELILRVLAGQAEDLEVRRLARWRAESEENERYYGEVAAIWGATAPTPPQGRTPPATTEVVRRGEALARQEWRTSARRRMTRRALPWAAAAAIGAVLGVWVVQGGRERTPLPGTEFASGPTEATTVTFSDGSFVRLDAGARVRFAGDADRREAWLAGRAFFGVTPDAARPFTVHTVLGAVQVLGTRFEVSEDEEQLRVVVVEGRVSVTDDGGATAEVEKGQVARLGRNGDFAVRSVDDVYSLLEWEGGLLLFQGTALEQVAEEVSAHFGVPVHVAPELTERSLTAWFEDDPLDEVVASVCLLVDAQCVVDGDGVWIGRR